jgi:hypothetical protein
LILVINLGDNQFTTATRQLNWKKGQQIKAKQFPPQKYQNAFKAKLANQHSSILKSILLL